MIQQQRKEYLMMRLVIILVLTLSGCTVKATLDTTTDGVTEFVSSSTGKSWWSEDGLVRQGEQLRTFIALNYENLLQDVARGNGEYLLSFGNVLGVSHSQRESFHHMMQVQYTEFANINISHSLSDLDRFIKKAHQIRRRT